MTPPSPAAEGATTRFHMHGAGALAALTGIYTCLLYVVTLLLAQTLGPENYGIYAVVMAVTAMVGFVATPGVEQLLMRDLAAYSALGRPDLARGLLGLTQRVSIMASIALAGATCLVGWLTIRDSTMFPVLLIGSLLIPIGALARTRAAALIGFGRVMKARSPELVVRPIGLAVACVVLLLSFGAFGPRMAMLMTVASAGLGAIIGAWWMRRAVHEELPMDASAYDLRRWVRSAGPFFLLSVSEVVSSQVGVTLVSALSSHTDAGLYAIVSRGAALIVLGYIGVAAAISPVASRLWVRGERDALRRLLIRMTVPPLAVALPLTAIMMAAPEPLLSIFGNQFAAGSTALRVMCLGQLFLATSGMFGSVLLVTGGERAAAVASLTTMTLVVVLNLLLVPSFGVLGGAWASTGSLVVGQTVMVVVFLRRWSAWRPHQVTLRETSQQTTESE